MIGWFKSSPLTSEMGTQTFPEVPKVPNTVKFINSQGRLVDSEVAGEYHLGGMMALLFALAVISVLP